MGIYPFYFKMHVSARIEAARFEAWDFSKIGFVYQHSKIRKASMVNWLLQKNKN